MKRIVVVLLLIMLAVTAYATSLYNFIFIGNEGDVIQIQQTQNSGYCYYVNDNPRPGKQSSIVEERLNKNKEKDKYYDPPLSKFVNLMSANEYLVNEYQNTSAFRRQFTTHNDVAVKFSYAGVEAFYRQIQYTEGDSLSSSTGKVSQIGFGAGSPNAEVFRAMIFGLTSDFSDSIEKPQVEAKYSGIKAQLAKRFRGQKMFTEIGAEYELYDISSGLELDKPPYINSYFTDAYLDWTPKSRISAYIVSSSITNRYQEPNYLSGIGSAASPMLLVKGMAHAFIVKGVREERESAAPDNTKFTCSKLLLSLPLNFTNYVGADLSYQIKQDKETVTSVNSNNETTEISETEESSDIWGGLRLTLLSDAWVRIVTGAEYFRYKVTEPTEYMAFFSNLVIKITHHVALIGVFRHDNQWLTEEGDFKLDPMGFHYGASLSARL